MGWLLVGLIVLVLLVLLQCIIGPTVLDRLISINAITSKVSMIILLIAFVRKEYGFIDIACLYVGSFVSGLWILEGAYPGDWQLRLPGVKGFEGDGGGRWRMIKVLTNLCFCGSLLAFGLGTLGLYRFPDSYTRLHAVGMGDTLGVGLLGLGLMLLSPNWLLRLKLGESSFVLAH